MSEPVAKAMLLCPEALQSDVVKAAFDFARFLSASALRSAASSISGCAESAAGEGRTRFFVDMGRANVGRHVG